MPSFQPYKAVLAGGTGYVGRQMTKQLLLSPLCQKLVVIGRQPIIGLEKMTSSSKLQQVQADFQSPTFDEDVADAVRGADVAFCLLGTRFGWANEADQNLMLEVDVGYTERFAHVCRNAGVRHFSLTSIQGADVKSYSKSKKTKALAEAAVAEVGFERLSIYRPFVITDEKSNVNEGAPGISAVLRRKITPKVSKFLPSTFMPVSRADLALAMRLNAEVVDMPVQNHDGL